MQLIDVYEGRMPYRLKDMFVLILARVTGRRIASVYRMFAYVTKFTMRRVRKSDGTSDISPR